MATGASTISPYTDKIVSNFAKFGYMNNITVYRAVKVLAEACAAVDWQVFTKGAKREEIPDHPIASLLNGPNTEQSKGMFITELVSYKLIAGTNYMFGSFPNASRVPLGLYNLRPDLVEPDDSGGYLQQWKYNNGKTITYYPLWKIKTIKFFHPLDPLHGLSPIQVAASVIERQNSGEEWNFSLMRNMARPSGAFVAATDLSDEARLRLKAEVIKKYGRGYKTAGMPMLLENGLQYMQLALSPIDADWFNSDASAGRKIAAAIGVDPLLLNDKEYSTYNNATEAKLALWELSGFPMMDTLRDDLNIWLVPFFGRDVEVDYDRRPIEAMKRNRQLESVTTVAEYTNGVRSFNDTSEELGLDAPLDDAHDFYKMGPTVYVMRSELPVWLEQQSEMRAATHAAGLNQQTQAAQATIIPTVNVSQVDTTKPKLLKPGNSKPIETPASKKEHLALSQNLELQRTPFYEMMAQALTGYFAGEETLLLSVLKKELSLSQLKAVLLTTQTQYAENLATLFATYYATIAEQAAKNIWQQFELEKIFLQQDTTSILAEHIARELEAIHGETQKDVAAAVQGAELQPEVSQVLSLQHALSQLYIQYKSDRATSLALNAVVLASNLGQHIAAIAMQTPLVKTWVASATCKHQSVDGQQRYLEEAYSVGGTHIFFPNCRCSEYYSHDYYPESNPYHKGVAF